MTKLWQKKYQLDKVIESYTVGNDFILDLKLAAYDCIASKAHAQMLGRIGLLSEIEVSKLIKELNVIISSIEKGDFEILPEQEDCHTAIETILIQHLGDLGKKIHTARSRNDQILVAMRLYLKDQIGVCNDLCEKFILANKSFAEKNGTIVFPGYTHMQKAMPSSISLWASCYADSMRDNLSLLATVFNILDQSPLGSAAGYGVPMELDREFTAKELGFSKVQENSIYVQHSRGKFEAMLMHAMVQVMLDLNRIASDLILFSMPEFGYFKLPDKFCTGSSIMPQKKNPDLLELMRANFHVVSSYEMQILQIGGNLISGYNRDAQLSKEPLMRGLEITQNSLKIAILLFEEMKVNSDKCADAMTDDLYATQKVYDLVKQGVPFRDAYKRVSETIHPSNTDS